MIEILMNFNEFILLFETTNLKMSFLKYPFDF